MKYLLILLLCISSGCVSPALAADGVTFKGRTWEKWIPGKRAAAAFVAALLASQGAQGHVNATVGAQCPAVRPVGTTFQSATVYFKGKECAVRCVAKEADWIGPLQGFCVDEAGCVDMYLQGAMNCEVDSTFVNQYNCSISAPPHQLPEEASSGDDDVLV